MCYWFFIFRVADINGDGLDDFICRTNSQMKVIINKAPLYFDTSDTKYTSNFCSNQRNFYTGMFFKHEDIKNDFLCLDGQGNIKLEQNQCSTTWTFTDQQTDCQKL